MIKYEYSLPFGMTNMSHIITPNEQYILLIAPIINPPSSSPRSAPTTSHSQSYSNSYSSLSNGSGSHSPRSPRSPKSPAPTPTRTDRIYVLNTGNMELKQSQIVLPFNNKPMPCHAILSHHNAKQYLFITGYIRYTQNLRFYKLIMDMDMERDNENKSNGNVHKTSTLTSSTQNWIVNIMDTIFKYLFFKQTQYLHIIQDFEPSHFSIPLSQIIN